MREMGHLTRARPGGTDERPSRGAGADARASGPGQDGGMRDPRPGFGRIAEGPPAPLPAGESVATQHAGPRGARVQRIASRAQADPPGAWYDQDGDEFVLLLSGAARLAFPDGTERALSPGDWAVLPARCRHRVAWTDPARETLWLAVHLPPPPHAEAGARESMPGA
jgi:cupin 2 domain-containing protein